MYKKTEEPVSRVPKTKRCYSLVFLLLFTLIPAPVLGAREGAPGPKSNRPVIGFVTGPSGKPPTDIALDRFDRERKRGQHLGRARALGSHVEDYGVEGQYLSPRTGITHILLRQRVNGIRVWNADFMVNVNREGRILNTHDRFAREPDLNLRDIPVLTPEEVLRQIAAELQLKIEEPFRQLEVLDDLERKLLFSTGGISLDPIPVSLMYVELDDGTLRLVWNIVVREVSKQHWWELNVDAETGVLLTQSDWVSNDSYRVFPHPVENPDAGGRQLLYDPADALASPYGWHDEDGVAPGEYWQTFGNNLSAHYDNGSRLKWARGGIDHVFDFPLDLAGASLDAMITNVFYWVNWNHDLHYHYGFNEAAGNFQLNNYGRGGDADDFVYTFVHDTEVGENAAFATPPDGDEAGMYLGIFTDDPTTVTVTSPAPIAGDYGARPATFGPALSETGIQGTVVAALDVVEGAENTSTDACSPILNSSEINGKIALVDRGICLFVDKVANAEAAGAIGVIIANNVPGIIDGMAGTDPTISIPSVLITQEDGNLLRAQLDNGVVARLHTEDLPDRDAAYDNGIIIHEYGHGVSNRLTGGRANASCLESEQSGALGEGWSDFWSIALLTQSSHAATDSRPVGTFVLGQPLNGTGLRNFPYSTDLGINPLTYEDIAAINLPHGGGEIWAAALLEVYWNLVEVHGFDSDVTFGSGGNNIALELVMDALKLQPCNPSFLDARDALLLADLNNYEAANRCSIWEGFAKRGMGLYANDGVNADSLDVVEDFSTPVECVPEPSQWILSFAAMLTLTLLRQNRSRRAKEI